MNAPVPDPLPEDVPTVFGIPLNRIVTFAGPPIASLAALVAAWLVAKVNVLGIPGLDQANVATWVAALITALLVAGLHALGGLGWLRGHHIQIANETRPLAVQLAGTAGTADDVPADAPAQAALVEATDPSRIPPDEGDGAAERKGA